MPTVSEIDIWRVAKQILDLYPEGAEMAAAQRADKAYEQGDMFNFYLWTRVTRAVRQLKRTKPDGQALN